MSWDCDFCPVDDMTWEQYAEHAYLEHGKVIMPPENGRTAP